MVTIVCVLLLTVALGFMLYSYVFEGELKKKPDYSIYAGVLVFAAVLVRVICAWQYTGHTYDMSCFRSWASRLAGEGFGAFYSSGNFNNYPPGYMYVLWVVGKIAAAFKVSDEAFNILLKMPAILLDLLSGIFIYRIAEKKFSPKKALIVMSAWLFNPAVITDSSLWGQVDIAYTFALGVMMYFIAERKLIYSYFMFALCILLKPQTFVITPVLIYAVIDQVFLPGFDKKIFLKNLLWGLAAIASIFIVSMPFGIGYVFKQYTETLKGSEYIVQNAFNAWAMLGKNYNWITMKASVIGYIFLAISVVFSAVVYFRSEGKSKVYFTAGLLMLCSFMLSVKMNERYAYAVMMFMLLAYIEKPDKGNALSYFLVTLMQFFNIAWVLFIFESDFYKYYPSKQICVYSVFSVLIFAFIIYVALKNYCGFLGKGKSAAVKG